jgi:hypothetical protein
MKMWIVAATMTLSAPAFGASMEYCRPYAAQTAEMLMKYVWLRAYTNCLNAEEDPKLPSSQATLFRLIPPAPGSVPATDTPKKVVKVKASGQALCISHNMRTVYSGRSWRCAK